MFGKVCFLSAFPAATIVVAITGCSAMQTTPMYPTQPVVIGGTNGVTAQEDAACRRVAYQDAQNAKETNVAKEVGFTAVGTVLGNVVGNSLEPSYRGPGPRGPRYGVRGRPPRVAAPAPRGWKDPGWGTAGAVTGGVVGAAASQAFTEDMQQVFDRRYNNCIATYRNANR